MKNIFLSSILLFTLFLGQAQERFGGAMLYTVRDDMNKNAEKTIEEVATIGYDYIELAGYNDRKFYGMSPKDFKAVLEENGLRAVSSHHSDITLENADQVIADVKALGISHLVIPIPPMGMFTYDAKTHTMGMKGSADKLLEILTIIGKKCNAQGLRLLYHNHDFEFSKDENGFVLMDYLLENTDPKFVNFQLDLYWTTKAGADPLVYFDRYPGRFNSFHVKDRDSQGRFSPVGAGEIDFKSIILEKEKAGMQYYFVEQDRTFDGMQPLEALKISHGNLKALGFE